MDNYVLGFAFNKSREYVLLIRKEKPEWQRGKLNGIGGKIEPNESGHQAMRREFREETGIDCDRWALYCQLSGPVFTVQVFRAFSVPINEAEKQAGETEYPHLMSIDMLKRTSQSNRISNLDWLIPLALDVGNDQHGGGPYLSNVRYSK